MPRPSKSDEANNYRIKLKAPETLTGERSGPDYKKWAHDFRRFTTSVNPKIKRALKWAEGTEVSKISEESYELLWLLHTTQRTGSSYGVR